MKGFKFDDLVITLTLQSLDTKYESDCWIIENMESLSLDQIEERVVAN
jgi:hypothetical protein